MQLLKWIFHRKIVTNSLVLPHKKVRIPECVLLVVILQYFEGRDNIVKILKIWGTTTWKPVQYMVKNQMWYQESIIRLSSVLHYEKSETNMWWIIGIVILVVLLFLYVRGADMRKRSDYIRQIDDEEQLKAIQKMS